MKGDGRALKIPAEGVRSPSIRARTLPMAAFNLGSRPRRLGRGIASELIGLGSGPNGGAVGASSGIIEPKSPGKKERAGAGRNEVASTRSAVSSSTRTGVWSLPIDPGDKDGADPPFRNLRDIARVVTISKTNKEPSPRHDNKAGERTRNEKGSINHRKIPNWSRKQFLKDPHWCNILSLILP